MRTDGGELLGRTRWLKTQSANLEQDPRFPSGPWEGFYLQYWLPGRWHPDEKCALTWSDGELRKATVETASGP